MIGSAGIFYISLLNLLVFTAGAAAFTVGVLLVRRPRKWGWYACAKLGIVLTSAILLHVVYPAEHIPLTFDDVAFAVGEAAMLAGTLGIAYDVLARTGRREGRRPLELRRRDQTEATVRDVRREEDGV